MHGDILHTHFLVSVCMTYIAVVVIIHYVLSNIALCTCHRPTVGDCTVTSRGSSFWHQLMYTETLIKCDIFAIINDLERSG